jgi:hypothetical protein
MTATLMDQVKNADDEQHLFFGALLIPMKKPSAVFPADQ